MTDILMLILTLAPSILLVAGACAIAVWATRLPDEHSSLVARLTSETNCRRGSSTRRLDQDTDARENKCAVLDSHSSPL